jgi:hypothetical protein
VVCRAGMKVDKKSHEAAEAASKAMIHDNNVIIPIMLLADRWNVQNAPTRKAA